MNVLSNILLRYKLATVLETVYNKYRAGEGRKK